MKLLIALNLAVSTVTLVAVVAGAKKVHTEMENAKVKAERLKRNAARIMEDMDL